ncbi:hypothetical protein [Nostoc commune]|nr:hypothetical protein [Nostoc commune]
MKSDVYDGLRLRLAENIKNNAIRDFQEINYPNKRTTEAQRTQREEK